MRKPFLVLLATVVIATAVSAAQRDGAQSAPAEQLLGTWTGTWEGGGSGGGFELTLERAKDGPIAGRVSVTGEPTYKANLKTLSFDGQKMSAKYDFTPDDAAEVVLAASFDGKSAAGTWSLREKATGNEVASGNWKVTRR
jgi:hypothetical protein